MKDKLILLKLKYPTEYEVHRGKVSQTHNLVLTTKDEDFAKKLVEGYNSPILFSEWLSENEWVKKVHTHPSKVGKYWSNIHCEYKTIGELFEMFCKETQL